MNKYLLLIVALIPLTVAAQKNFKEGYIVNLSGDTTKGFIDYKEWNQNPAFVNFTIENKNNFKRYSINDIQAFGVATENYQKYAVKISQNSVEETSTDELNNSIPIQKTVFLKVLVSGNKVSLFSFDDDLKTRYYVLEKTEAEPKELSWERYYRNGKIVTNNIYRKELMAIAHHLNDYSNELSNLIEHSNYYKADLMKILYKINGLAPEKPTSTAKAKFYAGAGLNYNSLKYTGTSEYSGSVTSSFNPRLTFGLEIIPVSDVKRSSVFFDVAAFTIEGDYSKDYPETINAPKLKTEKSKFYVLSLSPQFQYKIYNKKSTKLYLSAGIDLNYSVHKKYEEVVVYTRLSGSLSPDIYTDTDVPPAYRDFWLSFPVGAKLKINEKIGIYIKNSFLGSLTKYLQKDLKATKLTAFGVNYYF